MQKIRQFISNQWVELNEVKYTGVHIILAVVLFVCISKALSGAGGI